MEYNDTEKFEIGFMIPDRGDLLEAPKLERKIHNLNKLVKALCELNNQPVDNIKVSRVENGCVEFFFQQVFEVAQDTC